MVPVVVTGRATTAFVKGRHECLKKNIELIQKTEQKYLDDRYLVLEYGSPGCDAAHSHRLFASNGYTCKDKRVVLLTLACLLGSKR
jgi:hypothetical protein